MENQEIWKDVVGYEGLYQVSNLGRIKSLRKQIWGGKVFYYSKELIMNQNIGSHGYFTINLYKNKICTKKTVHQIISEAFLNHIPCGYKFVINHKNFNKLDNRIENLEVVTQRENLNQKHKISSSKYTGVYWCKSSNKWRSRIRIGSENKHLGCFTNEIDAHNAYENELKKILS